MQHSRSSSFSQPDNDTLPKKKPKSRDFDRSVNERSNRNNDFHRHSDRDYNDNFFEDRNYRSKERSDRTPNESSRKYGHSDRDSERHSFSHRENRYRHDDSGRHNRDYDSKNRSPSTSSSSRYPRDNYDNYSSRSNFNQRHGREPARSSHQSLSSSFKELSTSRDSFRSFSTGSEFPPTSSYPIRVKFNSGQDPVMEGESKDLTGNYFKLSTSAIKIYHYDVKISQPPTETDREMNDDGIDVTDDRTEKFIARNASNIIEEFKKCKNFDCEFIFDGQKNLFLSKQLSKNQLESIHEFEYKSNPNDMRLGRNTRVELSLVQIIDFGMIEEFYNKQRDDLPIIITTVMNLIFKTLLSKHFTFHMDRFYIMDKSTNEPSVPFLDFVPGFEISTRMSQIGYALVVNPKVATLFSKSCRKLIDLVERIDRHIPHSVDFDLINKYIKHIKIITKHGDFRRTYVVHSLVRETAIDIKFDTPEGPKVSVYEYFQSKYQIKVNPTIPLIKAMRGEYLPLELCYIDKSQFLNPNKINSEIQSILLKKSEFKPNTFFASIQDYVQTIINIDPDFLKEFGIKIFTNPARFNGYQIGKPRMANENPFSITEPGEKLDWAMISFDNYVNENDLEKFIREIYKQAGKIHLDLGELLFKSCVRISHPDDIIEYFESIKNRIKFCLVVIPEKHPLDSSLIYSTVSSCASQRFNLKLQCVNGLRVKNPPRGYFINLLYEINGKLGGQNSVIDYYFFQGKFEKIDFNKTMLIGVDVNHPGLKEKIRVSIAAASGTFNKTMTKYSNSIRVQKRNRTEIIDQLDGMIEELLLSYHKHNNYFPKNLIIFRDGVSEGQFSSIMKEELPLIQKALDKHSKNTTLTLLIVQKRHQTRFVTTRPYRDRGRETQNVPCGTVVDNTIVEPNFDIFYVNSHFSRLGTSKPTKFIAMLNELELTNAELHRLCYFVCFNCVRNNCPMSLPTPVFYADLCAYRAKIHILSHYQSDRVDFANRGDEEDENLRIQRLQQWADIKSQETKDSLFYV